MSTRESLQQPHLEYLMCKWTNVQGRISCSLQMNQLSLRNNWMKFKTSESYRSFRSNLWNILHITKNNQKITTCNLFRQVGKPRNFTSYAQKFSRSGHLVSKPIASLNLTWCSIWSKSVGLLQATSLPGDH
jgi:hypothetical protein